MARSRKSRKSRKKTTPTSALYVVGVLLLLALVVYVGVSVYGIFAPRPSREVESTVLVLNGCGEEDVGRETLRYLRDLGIDVVDARNAGSFGYEESIVVDRSGDFGAAVEVARMLRVPNVIQQIPETPLVDIIVVIGANHDWLEQL